MRYLTIKKFSAETGYTEKAIRNKIHDGTWAEGEVWVKAADGRILIDVQGYEKWVETGGVFGPLQKALSRSRSPSGESNAGSEFEVRQPQLT
ncbi:excisionase [Burkholderia stagnalis]|nr:excisionase [Burkholderia stagnalis]KWK65342.1 excisionase [Burkholderia stagnalis]KWN76665.1 excisionase [Burkholderia stagnalis]